MNKHIVSLLLKLKRIKDWLENYAVFPFFFAVGSVFPVNKKLAVFAMNFHYDKLSDNMQCIYDKLSELGYDCRVIIDPKNRLKRLLINIKFMFLYARSAFVFMSDNYDPAYTHKPRKGSRVIQLWHGCGAFKKWGYSAIKLAWGGEDNPYYHFPRHNTYTDVFVSAKEVVPCYAEAFNCSKDLIKPLGTPRTDIYFDKDFVSSCRNRLLKKYPEIGERKILLYAPTFRGESPETGYNDFALDLAALKENFSDEYALVMKLHPFVATKFSLTDKQKAQLGGFVFNASTEIPIEEALCAADVLIADYSSLIFEYALLDKPSLFFAYDLEKYTNERGFYYEYTDFVPGKIVKTNEELTDALKNHDFCQEKTRPFREKFMSACDGHSTERIVNYLLKE